jgi:hypothetical protein
VLRLGGRTVAVCDPARAVWASNGEINGVKYLLEKKLMTANQLLREVVAVNFDTVVPTVQFLLENGADVSNPEFVKGILARNNGSSDWRQFPLPGTWAVLFQNPSCPVDFEFQGKSLILFFATCGQKFAEFVCPVLAGRGLNPEPQTKLHCARSGWNKAVDAMAKAYKQSPAAKTASAAPRATPKGPAAAGGGSNNGDPAAKREEGSVAPSSGVDPKFEAMFRALVDVVMATNNNETVRHLRRACADYGWRV